MKRILFVCTLCALLVLVSGCHSHEESPISEEDILMNISTGDAELDDADGEASPETEAPMGEETQDNIDTSILDPSSDPASEQTKDANEQSGPPASQAPSEASSEAANNPDVPSEVPVDLNKNTTDDPNEYQIMVSNAEELEKYLRDTLSPDVYGGIYMENWGLGEDAGVFLYVWTVDEPALDSALAAYTGDPFPVERLHAQCSLTQLQQFDEALDGIKMDEDVYFYHFVSETYNQVACTVSDTDYEWMRSEIEQIARELHMPDEGITVHPTLPENPVT